MKNKCMAQFRLGGFLIKFILFNLAFLLSFQTLHAQASKIKFSIQEQPDEIIIQSPRYFLSIQKLTAVCQLKNERNLAYTSFPLHVDFNLEKSQQQKALDFRWKIQGKKISLSARQNNEVVKEAIFSFDDHSFTIQLGSLIPANANNGAHLFFREGQGFDTSGWEEYFSPEPDDYGRTNPTVDIRIDRDQQWFFSPAPLNLSFKTPAGWFSMGLVELPDASVFAFQQKSLWLDFAWETMHHRIDAMHRFEPIVFTFNESPWQAVGDYSAHLRANWARENKNPAIEAQPRWWLHPLVATWGEQTVQQLTGDRSGFNDHWVRWYVQAQEQALDDTTFTLIIDDKWARAYGDPHPASRFRELRSLIDWCHQRGHKVVLFWKAWKVEAGSIATSMNVIDGEYIDATHAMFESYVDSCSEIIFGNGPEGLDADGLKIDYLFLVRDPATAHYFDAAKGMGFKEVKRYLETFRQKARSYKADAMIMSSAIDPHFFNVQDMVRIHDDWDNKTRREKRARIIAEALPEKLINGDAADLSQQLASYHYVTSMIYGIPNFQYLTRFADGRMTPEIQTLFQSLVKLYQEKPDGALHFVDYGNWQIRDKNNIVTTESIGRGKGIIIYQPENKATLFCAQNSKLIFLMEGRALKSIQDQAGKSIPFQDLGDGIYELTSATERQFYQLQLRKASKRF